MTVRERDRETQRHGETQRDPQTHHTVGPSLSQDKGTKSSSPHGLRPYLSQGVSGRLLELHPKGESQASILGFILEERRVGTSREEVPLALGLPG